jgi:hypothetical protein
LIALEGACSPHSSSISRSVEHLAAVNQQHNQQRTLLSAAQRERPTILRDLKRPKYPKIHAPPKLLVPTATLLPKARRSGLFTVL